MGGEGFGSSRWREGGFFVEGRKAALERGARDRIRRLEVRGLQGKTRSAEGDRSRELARLGESHRCGRRSGQDRHRAGSCGRHQGRDLRRAFLYPEDRQQGGRRLLRQPRRRRRTAQGAHAREGRESRRQGEERQGVRGTPQEAPREGGAREKARALDLSGRKQRPGPFAARSGGADAGKEKAGEERVRKTPCSSKAAHSSSPEERRTFPKPPSRYSSMPASTPSSPTFNCTKARH